MAFIAPKHEGMKWPESWVQQMPCITSALDITILYPVGIATLDRHRTPYKIRKTSSSYSKQSHKAAL